MNIRHLTDVVEPLVTPNGEHISELIGNASPVTTEAALTAGAKRRYEAILTDILERSGYRDVRVESPPSVRADHASGTCRMSKNAGDGVVDKDLRIHDVENVFVCSNAVFPNAGAVNPTLTLSALALRLGTYLTSS